MKKAVILLSGGLDSVTTLFYAHSQKYELHAISFNYGQRNQFELECAKKNSGILSIPHKIIDAKGLFSGFKSSLLGSCAVSENRDIENDKTIPNTYVPARNIIFLSIASGFAESIKASNIFIGANAIDYSGYPDCRPEFISVFENMINVGTSYNRGNMRIIAPLINMTKSEIIKLGTSLGVDYSATSSCYQPINNQSCGKCDACIIRQKGFDLL